jgi:hypothetical protein
MDFLCGLQSGEVLKTDLRVSKWLGNIAFVPLWVDI